MDSLTKLESPKNLRASILKDLNGFNGGGAELKEARAFSKTLNENSQEVR